MDLLFPHHECELAQNTVTRGKDSVRYWMHNNLITINGQKMGKSLDNFITLEALFNGTHPLLTQSFHPMTIRFFILQAHYRGTLDFSNEALLAAGKGLKRLLQARRAADALPVSEEAAVSPTIRETEEKIYQALCDDMNTPIALAALFDLVTWINTASDAARPVSPADKNLIEKIYNRVVDGILGLKEESDHNQLPLIEGLVNMVLEFRNQARAVKNWAESDRIRDRLSGLGIRIKDSKEGTRWEL
jgi:cysteinyl-tRNA synthetase